VHPIINSGGYFAKEHASDPFRYWKFEYWLLGKFYMSKVEYNIKVGQNLSVVIKMGLKVWFTDPYWTYRY